MREQRSRAREGRGRLRMAVCNFAQLYSLSLSLNTTRYFATTVTSAHADHTCVDSSQSHRHPNT